MSQLAERFSQPEMGGANCFLRRLEAERLQEYGWQEPYESRGSRTVLRRTGGEIPPVYPTVSNILTVGSEPVISFFQNEQIHFTGFAFFAIL
jgi:hypothetical protein